ncbi:MAG: 50S ribosomal protein L28 [Thermodesulfobacteriota bacterium]
MSRRCEICHKGIQYGHNVSHSNRKTTRIWQPNLQRVRVLEGGRVRRLRVCTRCIRSGLIRKPA